MKAPSKITSIIISVAGVVIVLSAAVTAIAVSSNSAKVSEEALQAAIPLTEANFDAVTYYKIAQLPPKSEAEFDYANYPENTVPCDTTLFADYNALTDFINRTYSPAAAARITASTVNGSPRYFNQGGELCKTIAPTDTSYDKDFSSYTVNVRNVTTEKADIIVTVSLKAGGTTELVIPMSKYDGKWLLDDMVY